MAETEYQHKTRKEPARVVATTAFVEGTAGLCAITLSIIGLAHVFPGVLVAIATIALGFALLFETGAVSARYSTLVTETQSSSRVVVWGRWGGTMGGVAGIAFGILALLNVAPMTLVPIAAIVFGFSHLMYNVANARLNSMEEDKYAQPAWGTELFRETSIASITVQVLTGISGVALGILALAGISPMVLSLIAMLGNGSAFLLNGSVVGTKMLSLYRI